MMRYIEILNIRARVGSVEHYYHFMFGFLIPLAHYLSQTRESDIYFLRSCGPMNQKLLELNISKLIFVTKETLPRLFKDYKVTSLIGFDWHDYYNLTVFMQSRAYLLKKLFAEDNTSHYPSQDHPQIVLINRETADPFYQSAFAESKTSGRDRRSIPNFSELSAEVEAAGLNATTANLDFATLKQQAELFGNANIVVAQHGAALANIFWMRPKTKIIEICPQTLDDDHKMLFRKLAELMDVDYEVVFQESDHTRVDPRSVISAIMSYRTVENDLVSS
jgi:Glycosyltransferase 61